MLFFFFFKQKTAYEMRISDWSSDVCSSDLALALGIARIPVLDGRIFDLGIVERDQFHHGGVELVLVAHRRGAALQVGDVAALVGDDQRPLELAGILGVDPVIGGKLHRAAHALSAEAYHAGMSAMEGKG